MFFIILCEIALSWIQTETSYAKLTFVSGSRYMLPSNKHLDVPMWPSLVPCYTTMGQWIIAGPPLIFCFPQQSNIGIIIIDVCQNGSKWYQVGFMQVLIIHLFPRENWLLLQKWNVCLFLKTLRGYDMYVVRVLDQHNYHTNTRNPVVLD